MLMVSRGSTWNKWDLHIHTPSSEDYNYSGSNDYSDEKLVAAWKENEFIAVAITDHFLIDGERIKNLQILARQEGITVLPGVEFRTDKGNNNVHIISIFSEGIDVIELGKYFRYNMIKDKAQQGPDFETVYWDLKDIKDFTEKWEGLITVHAGNKASGIDDKMNHDTFFTQIKLHYASIADAFEVNNKKGYEKYKKAVLPFIRDRLDKDIPVIVSSDNHDCYNYEISSSLWIKADPTFEGLKQAFLHPSERIYIGDKPPKLIHEERKPQEIMKSIMINKIKDAESEENWFDTNLHLNSSLVCIIGNKGSGKSALSDILGLANKYNDKQSMSFLNDKRFNKPPNRYGKNYTAKLTWLDEEEVNLSSLEIEEKIDSPQTMTAEYLPQKHIEQLCTDLSSKYFQNEINKVIFSYIPSEERLRAVDFQEFMKYKTQSEEVKFNELYEELSKINAEIIKVEQKYKTKHKNEIETKIKELKSSLKRQINVKPREIPKPDSKVNKQEIEEIEEIKNQIRELTNKKNELNEERLKHSTNYQRLLTLQSEVNSIINKIDSKNTEIREFSDEIATIDIDLRIQYVNPSNNYNKLLSDLNEKNKEVSKKLNDVQQRLDTHKKERDKKLKLINKENQAYQSYLTDLKQWEKSLEKIKGSEDTFGTLYYFESELEYLNTQLQLDYNELIAQRKETVKKIYDQKREIKKVYDQVYNMISSHIIKSLEDMDEDIKFNTQIIKKRNKMLDLLDNINKRPNSIFQGTDGSKEELNKIINEMDTGNFENMYDSLNMILGCGLKDDYDQLEKVVIDKQKFYDDVLSMQYLEVDYHLTYNGNTLEELSPGERGLLLLVFYLLLSKDKKPIIIDQPEDNLDNESIFTRLVPCIIRAKKNRQVIIVTHNPNIAIACDAEQVVIANINKKSNEIKYTSGSIENNKINDKIVKILEGTKPAFRLRGNKYTSV